MDSKCYWTSKYLTRSIENRKNLQNRAKSNDCIESELQWVSTNISILLSQNNIIFTFVAYFSRIRTEYGDLLRKSPYSVRMRENVDQKKLRIRTLFTQWLV